LNLLEAVVVPRSPWRMPGGSGETRRDRAGVLHRLLHVDGAPVLVRCWQKRSGEVIFRADGVPALSDGAEVSRERLEVAIERMRFSLAIDDDLSEFYEEFKNDRMLGPVIRRKPWIRARRAVTPWGALLRAITGQLIEATRALEIERTIVRRWGTRWDRQEPGRPDLYALWDTPAPEVIAGVAPAELVRCDLAEKRAIAMIKCAREVDSGRADLMDPASDARLLKVHNIGPWTVQLVGRDGRGDPDSLPAGDLAYVKLVGRLAGLGRRATIEEIEDFYAPYEGWRALAGVFSLIGYHREIARGKPMPFVHEPV
jgi:3-methyladenine DNA glycosylase/8-oxoguanine DNA glycosylase